MIPDDKDRFECLRLAASLYTARQGVTADVLPQRIVQCAEAFFQFVTGGKNGKAQRTVE